MTSKTKVLIVEDGAELREDVIETLTLEGYDAIGAANGLEGVKAAREHLPDLILCDIMMPVLDGFGMLEQLREDSQTATIPFIFLTAKTERPIQRQGMVLGADDFMTKPFVVDELLESIEAQLKKRADLNAIADQRVEAIRESITTALPHELRTPLNTIIGFSDILLSESARLKPDQIAAWAKHINGAGNRLYRVIENYLFYAKFQVATENEIQLRATDPVLEFGSVITNQAKNKAREYEREADLVMEVEDAPEIYIDHEDAVRIVAEVVDNAFKFSKRGDKVCISAKSKVEGYELAIEDSGLGMTQEQINSIGAFTQFDRYIHEQQGLGLGLAIVDAVATSYNLDFDIQSEFGVGSTITLRFKTR